MLFGWWSVILTLKKLNESPWKVWDGTGCGIQTPEVQSFGAWILNTILSLSFFLMKQKVKISNLLSGALGFSVILDVSAVFYTYCGFFLSQVEVFPPSLMVSLWVLKICIDNFHVGYMSLSRVLGTLTNGLLCAMDILLLASLNYVICSKCLKLQISLVDN